MSLADALARGRSAAEARMLDRVRLYTQGDDVFDRETGETVPGAQTVLYEGQARVKPVAQASGEDAQAGEREVMLREIEVSLPWSTPLPSGVRVLPGSRVAVLAAEDPRMTGLVLWVTGAQYGSQATAWRLSTEDRS
ncbi:DUF6093 family protein [Streptomyces sp. NPDC060198]|uniref:DUF6093 family protein n=1 Tax=Streptomyces sp. NPDC060198 TaxID=3347070 RepID=UPI0036516535